MTHIFTNIKQRIMYVSENFSQWQKRNGHSATLPGDINACLKGLVMTIVYSMPGFQTEFHITGLNFFQCFQFRCTSMNFQQ